MIELPALEYHVAHTCNLSCEQCSHYSNFHPTVPVPSPEETAEEYAAWNNRLRPRRFALLGGEPTLNPRLVEHVRLACKAWPDSDLMLVSNGFFLHRHPELPGVLVEANCRLDVSQHGTAPRYMKEFAKVKRLLWRWRAEYPGVRIKIRQSHRGWMRQYRVVNGKLMPFNSDPEAAYGVCMQKACTQLYRGCLVKCPALAYFPTVDRTLRLVKVSEWQSFRDYKACPPTANNLDVAAFLATKPIPQCDLCPDSRDVFRHHDPMLETDVYTKRVSAVESSLPPHN
jgi:hypothetical protein